MDGPSGYGFELTLRLKKQPGETAPPAWPAELLQQLARYVFQTGLVNFNYFISSSLFIIFK
jgi:suppressor of fused-like protein